MGQGYSDVMNPSIAHLMRNFGGNANVVHPQPAAPPNARSQPPPSPPVPEPVLETDDVHVPEEKVSTFSDIVSW